MLALTLLSGSVSIVFAQDWDCSDPGNLPQQGMNYCAALDFEAADAELNALWPRLVEQARDNDALDIDDGRPGYEETLRDAQRAWIVFRDANCSYEGYAAKGGSLEPLLVATCRAAMTRDRIGELKDQLQGLGMQ